MTTVCWRVSCVGTLTYRTRVGTVTDGLNAMRLSATPFGLIMQRIDPLRVAIDAAHKRGLKILVYYTMFDEAYLEPSTGIIHECDFGRRHPEYYLVHHSGSPFVRGVFSFGYPEVRKYFAALVREALGYESDGVYLDFARTHAGANPIPVHGWYPQWTNPYLAYGYNEPDVARYREKYGKEPPMPSYSSSASIEPTEEDRNWNRVRGEAATIFLREIRPMVKESGKELHVCFYPSTYNGFNPGCHCRQMLGRYHIDWRTWVKEGLVDAIRLNVDHRRFGYDDWVAASAEKYRFAQERGIRVFIDCAIEGRYDQLENSPEPPPIRKDKDPETFFHLMGEMTEKILRSSADGVFFYEHCGNDERTWQTIAAAKRSALRMKSS